MARRAYDALIRDLYVSAPRGPLRVAVGEASYPPFLERGDVALLERGGIEAARPGEFVGVRDEDGEVRLLRYLGRAGEGRARLRLLAPARLEERAAGQVIGRVTEVERGGARRALRAARGRGALALERLKAELRRARRRGRLQSGLARVYWSLADSFDQGVSETGDLLITDRCPVGCRFCIYSCVPAGSDMDLAVVRRAARSFRRAGIPRVRLLGGEPFYTLPHLVRSFRAVRESYPAERIIVLTSAYFGTSPEAARAKLDPMVAEGLRELHLSFDAFHLERYPAACYERVLDECRARGLDAVLVVHYSDGLAPELDRLLALRERYRFGLRLTMVSREGDARQLRASETSVAGFARFRSGLVAGSAAGLVPEDQSCFRWTVFPSGAVHFCCKDQAQNRVGDLAREDLPELQRRLREAGARNRLNVLRFAAGHTGEVSGNPCLTCPLTGSAGAEAPAQARDRTAGCR